MSIKLRIILKKNICKNNKLSLIYLLEMTDKIINRYTVPEIFLKKINLK